MSGKCNTIYRSLRKDKAIVEYRVVRYWTSGELTRYRIENLYSAPFIEHKIYIYHVVNIINWRSAHYDMYDNVLISCYVRFSHVKVNTACNKLRSTELT